ncbi:hypothetical protein Nmel_003516, partial [Mimus melanotis]
IPQGRVLSTSPAEFQHGAAFATRDPEAGKDACAEPGYRSSSVTSLGYSGSREGRCWKDPGAVETVMEQMPSLERVDAEMPSGLLHLGVSEGDFGE